MAFFSSSVCSSRGWGNGDRNTREGERRRNKRRYLKTKKKLRGLSPQANYTEDTYKTKKERNTKQEEKNRKRKKWRTK
jgi:hypothetical protein